MKFNKFVIALFCAAVPACSLLLLQPSRSGGGEWKILAIYWVNLCLPVQWLRIPFMLQYRCINYDYRKHQFFACYFLASAEKRKPEDEEKNWTEKTKGMLRRGESERENYKWFHASMHENWNEKKTPKDKQFLSQKLGRMQEMKFIQNQFVSYSNNKLYIRSPVSYCIHYSALSFRWGS
jgi:hypothetical protein